MSAKISVLSFLLTSTALVSPVAADVIWTGSGTDWSTPGNWGGGAVPGASDNAEIDGPANVTIGGAAVTVNAVQLGETATGASLTIGGGGSLSATGYSTVGAGVGGIGAITVTGTGSSATFYQLQLGYSGSGTLSVTGGGTVVTTDALIGAHDNGGSVSVVVSGSGSHLTATTGMLLGEGTGATSTVTVQNGGTLETVRGGLYLFGGSVMTVTGAGTQLLVGTAHPGTPDDWTTSDGWLMLQHASLTVSNGARVETDGVYVKGGDNGVGDASMTLTGAGTTLDGHLVIYVGGDGNGNGGNGAMMISDGATATASIVGAGNDHGSTGKLVLTGAGSSLSTVPHGSFLGNAYAGSYGDGTIVVQDGAELHVANQLRIGYYSGATGKLVIGAEEGQAAAAPGTVTAAHGVVFGAGTGELVFNHTASDYVFAPSITGTGTIKALAGTTTLTGDSSGFTGALDVTGGILRVSGAIGAVAQVESGATLTGSGTVGGVTALAGSIISPGNSPGTLTVVGNYQQAAGSTYKAELVPGSATSDLISVTGTATLAPGAVLQIAKYGSGAYAPGARYTVLTATGGLTGTYLLTGDTAASAFYSWQADYDANNVYLGAVQTRAFTAAAATPNQIATAGRLQSLVAGNSLRAAIGYLATDAAAQNAFDQLSGDIHSSIKGAMVDDSHFVRNAAVDRLRSAFETVGAQAAPSATYGVDGLTLWSNGYGAWGDSRGDGNTASLSHNIGGLFMGADLPVFDTGRLGVLGGYSRSTYGEQDRNASGSADNYSLGLYGGAQLGNLGLRFGSAYTWSTVDTNRNVAFTGFSDRLSGKYNAGTAQVFTDLGYRIDAGGTPLGTLSFEPFVGLAYVNAHTEGFTEQGGLAALTSRSGDTGVTFSTLGLRGSTTFTIGGVDLTASGTGGWRHASGDVMPTSTLSLRGSDPFNIVGTPIARDAALVETGLSTNLATNVSLAVSYTGQFGDGAQSQGVRGNLNVKF